MQLPFDASLVEPAKPLDPVPSGWYNCMMTASEGKPASTGQGNGFMECEYTILDGAYKDRKLFDRFNLWNTNPVAVEIAYKQLSAVCHATGIIKIDNTEQLHNRPLQVKAALKPAGPGRDGVHYEASNEVKGYKGIEAAAPVAPPPGPVVPPAAPWAPPQPAAPAAPVAPPAAPAQWTPPAAVAPAAPAWTPPAQPAASAPVAPATPAAPPWAAPAGGAPAAATPPWAKK